VADEPSGVHRPPPPPGHDLDRLARAADQLPGARRRELAPGDRVIVATRNSIYSIESCEDGTFLVAGGWFERQGESPARVRVNGCTTGGTALLSQLVAAPGLFLEFGNGVKTTRIRRVRVIRAAAG
jgi:hypothetical protein